ncbi:hypothetical protein B0H10DRAFT_1078715 [Mycena sp. CBHHK59/15]|nr:hypothetical protein B0H10DRAFT_1078715 [Mycena sp. CBHHK59/15]
MCEPGVPSQIFLPALYATLDPARIPSPHELDTTSPLPSSVSPILLAHILIQCLFRFDPFIPPEVRPDLWPRLWKWMEFIDIYGYCLPAPAPAPETTRGYFVLLIGSLQGDGETAKLIDATPGVRVFVATAWTLFLQYEELDMVGLASVSHFIRRCDMSPTSLEEFVEGAGGSLNDLASLVVKHIDTIVSNRHTPMNGHSGSLPARSFSC